MKSIIVILGILYFTGSISAFAADVEKDNNVIIVNGKKFFLLNRARRYSGVPRSPAVIHSTQLHKTLPLQVDSAAVEKIKKETSVTPESNTTPKKIATPQDAAKEIMSIFSPEETGSIKK